MSIRRIDIGLHGESALKMARKAALCACALVIAVSCLVMLAGCKDSKAIKNIVHDQDSEIIDHESGEKNRVVSEDGRFIGEDTGLYDVGGSGADSLPVNVLYASSDPETELPTPRFFYDPSSTNDSEATEGTTITPPDEPQQEWDEVEPEIQPRESAASNPANTATNQNAIPGSNPSSGTDGQNGKQDEFEDVPDKPAQPPEDQTQKQEQQQAQPTNPEPTPDEDDEEPQVYDASGKTPEIPNAARIAAFGQVAVLVQMLGGADGLSPLVAADDQLCSSEFARVFADEGVSAINAQAFLADGSGGYTPDVEQIVASGADTVLVFTDGMFTKDQKKALKKADVSITVVPTLTSDTRIMRAAENISKMLDEATEGRSAAVFQDYKAYHDALIADVEGVRGYGAYGGTVCDADMSPRPAVFGAQKFTLLIDEWDYGATYNYRSVISDAGAGIGLATVGYRTSPVSYYLGVAGVVNNAAAIDTTIPGAGRLAPAWQFNPNDLNPSAASFSRQDITSRLYDNWGTGFTKTTLSKASTNKLTLRDNSFGTDTFPVVIVATARMRDAFIASASAPDGIYHPFGYVTTAVGTIAGTAAGSTPVFTVIDENLDVSNGTSALVVNPHGLFSSWLEGSAESFLECAWAANIPDFSSDWTGTAASEVKAFYQTFYRYDIADAEVDFILGGLSG